MGRICDSKKSAAPLAAAPFIGGGVWARLSIAKHSTIPTALINSGSGILNRGGTEAQKRNGFISFYLWLDRWFNGSKVVAASPHRRESEGWAEPRFASLTLSWYRFILRHGSHRV